MSDSATMVHTEVKQDQDESSADSLTQADLAEGQDVNSDLSQYNLRYEFTNEVPTESFGDKQQKMADLITNLVRLRCRISLEAFRQSPEEFRALVLTAREQVGFARAQMVNLGAALEYYYPKLGWRPWCFFILKALFNRSYTQLTTIQTLNHEARRGNMEKVVASFRSAIEKTSDILDEVQDQVRNYLNEIEQQKQRALDAADKKIRQDELDRTKKQREADELEAKEQARKRSAKIQEALKGNVVYQQLAVALSSLKSDLELAEGVQWGNERDMFPNKLTDVYNRNNNRMPAIVNYSNLQNVLKDRLPQEIKATQLKMKDIEEGVVIHLDLDSQKANAGE